MNEYEEVLCFFINEYIDTSIFTEWLFKEEKLSEYLDEQFYFELISTNFNDKNAVISLKNSLRKYLTELYKIDCNSINDAYCERRAVEESRGNTINEIYKKLYDYFNKPRLRELEIDVYSVNSSSELQNILKEKLGFLSFYGKNWDAFWDAITGLIEMPEKLIIRGWANIQVNLPEDAELMKKLLSDLNSKYPSWGCEVVYA